MIFFETEADPTEWFLMPLHWTEADQEKIDEWAATCAEIMRRRHRKWWKSPSQKALAARFRLLAEAHPHPAIPADQVFLYGGDPRRVPQPFYALTVDSTTDDHAHNLRVLVQATEDNPVRAPEVEPFVSERLGEGLRCLRFFGDEERLSASLNYGWWNEETQRYAAIRTVTDDIGWLIATMDDFDEFVRTIWLNPNPQ